MILSMIKWFNQWLNDQIPDFNHPWLEFRKSKNAAFCFIYRYFGKNNSIIENTHIKTGFKKASQKFKCQETTNTHKTARILYLNRSKLPDSCASQ